MIQLYDELGQKLYNSRDHIFTKQHIKQAFISNIYILQSFVQQNKNYSFPDESYN